MAWIMTPNDGGKRVSEANPLDRVVKPTFSEWLRSQPNLKGMTASEMLGWIAAAQRRGTTVEKLLGYPWA